MIVAASHGVTAARAPEARPVADPRTRRQVWSVGGGKGGIGKSLLAASIGWQLARAGRRVVLVDADLGGANLHNYVGLPAPASTLGDFIQRRVSSLEGALTDTPVAGLRLLSGAADLLAAANIGHQQKLRVMRHVLAIDADVVLLDLGAGTSHNVLDLFLLADVSILVVVPEHASIEIAYRFVKGALYRRLLAAAPTEPVRALVQAALDPKGSLRITTPDELLDLVEAEDADAAAELRRQLLSLLPRFVVNQVRDPSEIVVGHQLVAACRRHLGLPASYAGYVHHDDAVWQAVRRRRPLLADAPASRAAREIGVLADRLTRGETLGHGY